MKSSTLVLAVLLSSTAAVALAQSASDAGANGERQQRWQKRADATLAESDSNHDGRISQSEWQSAQLRKSTERFKQLDLDRDGKLSREELASGRDHGDHEGRGGGMRERMRALDTDGDGQFSRAELGDKMPRLTQDFDRIDANHDGKLSHEEMRAARPHRDEGERDGANPQAASPPR